MDQRAAFEDTIALAEQRCMPLLPGNELGLEHLRRMLEIVASGVTPQDSKKAFSEGKLGRWLGWAQAAVVSAGLASLDDMKAVNKKHAGTALTPNDEVPNDLGGRTPGQDANGNYSTAQMMRDEMEGGDTSQPLFD